MMFYAFPYHLESPNSRDPTDLSDLHGDLFGCQPFTVWIRLKRNQSRLHNPLPCEPKMCLNMFNKLFNVAKCWKSFCVEHLQHIPIFLNLDQHFVAHSEPSASNKDSLTSSYWLTNANISGSCDCFGTSRSAYTAKMKTKMRSTQGFAMPVPHRTCLQTSALQRAKCLSAVCNLHFPQSVLHHLP